MEVTIILSAEETFSYAYQLSDKPFISKIEIINKGTEDTKEMKLCLSSNPCFFEEYTAVIPSIPAGKGYVAANVNVAYDLGMLANITEEMKSSLCCQLFDADVCVTQATKEIEIRPYDELSNWEKDLKEYAVFVTPNHPDITKLVTLISDTKGKTCGEYSIVGYFYGKEEVLKTIRCSYDVVRELEITYVYMKQGFHSGWQRIRLVDEILKEKQGNCMDLTLLFASIFEAESLNPVIVVTKGHAFVGVWTKKHHLDHPVYTNKEQIYNILTENKEDLVLIECTLARKGAQTDYDGAVKAGYEHILKQEELVALVDVKAARERGVRPIPSRISPTQEKKEEDPFFYPPMDDENIEGDESKIEIPDKIKRWKNKLLDLTAGSDLLNIKITPEGKRAAALPEIDIEQLYEKVKSGSLFSVTGKEKDQNIVQTDLGNGILHTNYTSEATKKLIAFMHNKDSEFRDQKGASIMYLTLGGVRWEEKKSGKWYEAPVLMVPMAFKKEGQNVKLYYDGSDIHVNAAVLEMTKARFNRQPKGVNPEPLGVDGKPDIKVILQKLTSAFKEEAGLEVSACAYIGIFAFAQYMMWNDLDKNEELYLSHPIIHSIKEGQKDTGIDEDACEFDADKVFLPIPADGAQIKAMTAALSNRSFVLHGPPGTGKSQTITGMLANFIGHDRTVLFAAEKAAALQVVYNRIKQIGLDDFCLYLPVDSASRATMARFLKQYKDLMEHAEAESTAYEEITEKIKAEREKLEEQLAIFDSTSFAGYTLKELIGNVLNNTKRLVSSENVNEVLMEQIRDGKLKELEELLKDTMYMGTLAGDIKNHPLGEWGAFTYRFGMQKDLRKMLRHYQDTLKQAAVYAEELEKLDWKNGEANQYLTEWEKCQQLLHTLKIPESVRNTEDLNRKLTIWIGWLDIQEQREEIYKALDPGVEKLNLERMANKWKAIKNAKTYEASYEKLVLKNQLAQYIHKEKPSDRYITEMFELALKLKKLNEEYPKKLSFSIPLDREQAKELRSYLDKYFPNGIPKAVRDINLENRELLKQLEAALKEKAAIEKEIEKFPGKDIFPFKKGMSLTETMEYMDRQIEALDTLREWSDYQRLKASCVEHGLEPWIALYEKEQDAAQILADFLSYSCEAMLHEVYETQDVVKEFTGYRFDHLVEKFAENMDAYYAVCAKEIRYRHLMKIQKLMQNANYEKDKVALKKMIEADGKGITIREIMERVGSFVLKLTPCVMATPMTTSMYFAPQAVTFDHMILDEASQLQTCKSVGLIVRSKHSIIVGDPNQMPPTSFFESTMPDYQVDVLEEDQESILKDFIALDMPDYYLRWHYRSHHESLIAFSNRNYYGGCMITFPAADNTSKVSVVRTNGIYDRGNTITNQIEAEALAEKLEEMVVGGDTRSVGIIAFNKRQQTLIQQLIEKRAEENEAFAQGLEQMSEAGEPLFVRNLESVQGDERDVILFSVGYGPDKEGKIVMAFGPLGKVGGWRRLNVAITRARDEMILFTSMDSEQMILTETTSRGVKDLKNFIAYAEGKEVFAEEDAAQENREMDGFAEAICTYLTDAGYTYDTKVGNSALKVDIAVYDEEKEQYVLGIMLNNKKANNDFTIYDSEVGQNRILKKQGWKLLRIWSLDWYEDSEREMKRIQDCING